MLFVQSGWGTVTISGRPFAVGPETGVLIRPTEAFSVRSDGRGPIITACPAAKGPRRRKDMPAAFDESVPTRVASVDPTKREPMADRFYQMLMGEDGGLTEVTQFMGELPMSL